MAHEQAPTPSVLLQVPPLAQDIAAHEGPERQQKRWRVLQYYY